MSTALHLATAGTLLGVLAVAASAKVRRPDLARAGLVALAPARLARWRAAPQALAGLEAALALGLLLPGDPGRVALVATAAVLAVFTAALARAARRRDGSSCGCFGAWSDEPVTALTVARTAGLTVLAVVALVTGWGAPGLLAAAGSASGPEVAAAAGTALLLVLVLVLVTALGVAGGRAVPSEAPRPDGSRPAGPGPTDPADLSGQPVPVVEVVLPDGQVRELRHLAHGRAVLLVVASLECGTCHEVLDEVPVWQADLGRGVHVLVVTSSDRDPFLRRFPALRPHLALGSRGVRDAFGVPGTPSAVLLGADRRVATRVAVGADEVLALLAGTLEAVERAGAEPGPAPHAG
ncbi:TlpA family protein disulfide reductase [Nocardioides sp. CPCC 205120]|uniref:TlpA family protein disulfide reductase n=1 Tax=Nocardioides sp. CPCC 205120 TaxID=3406462 RepID=UPI003B503D64